MKVAVLSVAALWMMTLASALQASEPVDNTIVLFNGKNLDGWEAFKCEVEVKDGAIFIKSGNGMLYTKKQYADFVLDVEWKALSDKFYDSGVFFRVAEDSRHKVWPRLYQSNLQRGDEGNVGGLKGATSKGLVKAGEWNHFRLTCQGERAKLEINGKLAWDVGGVTVRKGYLGLQAEVPAGGQFLFRNIRLKVLTEKK
jgi:hypothetical protein